MAYHIAEVLINYQNQEAIDRCQRMGDINGILFLSRCFNLVFIHWSRPKVNKKVIGMKFYYSYNLIECSYISSIN